ncbi:MAG TPA: 3-methyl-2-oxobutanoate hydroxymethyltransferase [Thermodesulfovibrionia bacterium]|nr:3-methyl-2-oxobutanoate hydroxymethyltransferase [Thermodesulfovibrionia bacterium]
MARFTVQDFYKKKQTGEKIVMLTAYDFPFARIVDEAGIHAILVGDSLAMVVQGLENTMPVTMDEMIYHTRMVSRAVKKAMVLGDMPYMSYQSGVRDAVLNASRFLKEAGAQGVKIEGGLEVVPQIKAMVQAEIPVMAHIGLTPQSIHRMGGYKIQGKTEEAAKRLIDEAFAVQEAGAFSLVLEAMPVDVAEKITTQLDIPTIGIGAGSSCNGQVLVLHDVLGLFERFTPRFVKTYVNLKEKALSAIAAYKDEVEKGLFPTDSHSFK